MPSSSTAAVGIDFGTTNSSIAIANADGSVQLARFPFLGRITDAYRSLLYFEPGPRHGPREARCWTGPAAIERYLAAEADGRLIQSLKSFLTSRDLQSTTVLGRRRSVEELIARILTDLREEASRQFGVEVRSATVGRPVRFVGATSEDDNAFAERRLMAAFRQAGYEDVTFEFEPVAAAHHYESTLDHDELILIGDFGGGTSDFSLIRVGPSVRRRGRTNADLIGTSGVGLAGDAFDAQIVRHLVSPALGAGTSIRSMDKILSVPAWPYTSLERWHHLSFLKTREVIDMLERIEAQALQPAMLRSLIHIITNDLGYQLHRSVQHLKSALSNANEAGFEFTDGDTALRARVTRADFESWIAEDLLQIEGCVDSLFDQTGVVAGDIDAVFLTGGSSFVPAVRQIFTTRFGEHRLRSGQEFTSVAMGLARQAARDNCATV
ncbi:MAG: Hsp70 family protein [Acidobacteriota bacterium]